MLYVRPNSTRACGFARRAANALALMVCLIGAPAGVAAQAEPGPDDLPAPKPRGSVLRDVKVSGYIQGGAVLMDQASQNTLDPDTQAPLNQERAFIRRGRLVTALKTAHVFGSVALDGSTARGPRVQVKGAVLGLRTALSDDDARAGRWPLVEGRLGLMASPFGREHQRSSRARPFLERSNAINAFFPGTQDVGVEARGQWRFVRYQLALMNGEPLGSELPAQDPTGSKDVVGRLGVVVEVARGVVFEVAASGLQGEGLSPPVATTKDTVQWVDANENGVVDLSELQPVPGVAGRAAQTFERSALGADLCVTAEIPVVGPLRVFGDVYWALNLDRAQTPADPVVLGRDLRELGWMVGVEQALTRHARFALRYDTYDPDADATEQIAAELVPRDRSVSTLAVSASWTTLEAFALNAEYNRNNNNDGRAADGSPIRLNDDRVVVWAQVAF